MQAINREVKEEDADARIQNVLHDFTEDSSGNVAKVIVNEDDVTACIVFQTYGMRKPFALFPEVLMIDSTHHTNGRRNKLFGFMLHDAFDKVQFAQFALLDQEMSVNMRHATEAFKEHNPEWPSIEVIVVRNSKYLVSNIALTCFDVMLQQVDKDMTEVNVLEEAFKDARVCFVSFTL